MTIDGKYYTEPELAAKFRQMQETIDRLDGENYKLTEENEKLGGLYNDASLGIGYLEQRCEELETREKEYKRLLKAAVDDFHWLAEWRDKCALCGSRNVECDCAVVGGADCDEVYTWRHEAEAHDLIGETDD